MPADPVTELELDAYLDGELDPPRCLAVEEHLARDPAAATRMMGDLALRRALRMAQPALDEHMPATLLAGAARLGQRLRPQRRQRFAWIGAAAALALVGGAIVTQSPVAQARTPAYVANALQAYQTGLLRADMPSQIEAPHLDAADVRRFTRIRIPVLPSGWRITDVQLFPSDQGPALQVMIRTPVGEAVSIFALRSSESAPARPITVQRGSTSVAYWRHGDMAYALTGMGAPAALDVAAADLADNRIG